MIIIIILHESKVLLSHWTLFCWVAFLSHDLLCGTWPWTLKLNLQNLRRDLKSNNVNSHYPLFFFFFLTLITRSQKEKFLLPARASVHKGVSDMFGLKESSSWKSFWKSLRPFLFFSCTISSVQVCRDSTLRILPSLLTWCIQEHYHSLTPLCSLFRALGCHWSSLLTVLQKWRYSGKEYCDEVENPDCSASPWAVVSKPVSCWVYSLLCQRAHKDAQM